MMSFLPLPVSLLPACPNEVTRSPSSRGGEEKLRYDNAWLPPRRSISSVRSNGASGQSGEIL